MEISTTQPKEPLPSSRPVSFTLLYTLTFSRSSRLKASIAVLQSHCVRLGYAVRLARQSFSRALYLSSPTPINFPDRIQVSKRKHEPVYGPESKFIWQNLAVLSVVNSCANRSHSYIAAASRSVFWGGFSVIRVSTTVT